MSRAHLSTVHYKSKLDSLARVGTSSESFVSATLVVENMLKDDGGCTMWCCMTKERYCEGDRRKRGVCLLTTFASVGPA